MATSTPKKDGEDQGQGPKFVLDIEGRLTEWDQRTITTEQIAQLGGWDPALGVIQVDKEQNERTLQPGEVVELKPGMGFSKKVHWKRGVNLCRSVSNKNWLCCERSIQR